MYMNAACIRKNQPVVLPLREYSMSDERFHFEFRLVSCNVTHLSIRRESWTEGYWCHQVTLCKFFGYCNLGFCRFSPSLWRSSEPDMMDMDGRRRSHAEIELGNSPAPHEAGQILLSPPLQPRERPPIAAPPSTFSRALSLHAETCNLITTTPDGSEQRSLGSELAIPSPWRSPVLKGSKWSPGFLTPIGTPIHRTLHNLQHYLEEVGPTTTLNVRDTWLPLTERRTGNTLYASFHNLNAMIGYQAIFLPFAFVYLGW